MRNYAAEARARHSGANRYEREWLDPKPLPNGLAPVDQFASEFMPDSVAPWVNDITDRLQCPPDYVAVAAMTALGAVIGRRIAIKPQMKTDWSETSNLWGVFIGSPGMLKSPAMNEALKPIHRLEAEAAKDNEVAMQAYLSGLDAFKVKKEVAASLAKAKLKKDMNADVDLSLGDEPEEPVPLRYRTNDSSYEALGELLIGNPAGILVERDELVSLLKHLDREDQAVAPGFYLSGWSGNQLYTFDRIIRGTKHIDAVCISVLGNTQPARIGEYVRRANAGGAGGDGLIQRFGLMVWPDAPARWRDVDQYPDSRAREAAWQIFNRLSKLDKEGAIKLGATLEAFDSVPCLRFDDAAHADFLEWRTDLERRLRSEELSPALEGHLAKYRKLVPALALINQLADSQDAGAVSQKALLKALSYAEYLETHAKRVYGASSESERAAAAAILAKIKGGHLATGFTARDVHQHDWSRLTDIDQVRAGLNLLVELDYLAQSDASTGDRGGRPKTTYAINPKALP
jgi:Protein of unknown function (DUF3987)